MGDRTNTHENPRPLIDRLDDQHRVAVENFPAELYDLSDIEAARATMIEVAEAFPAPDATGVTITDTQIDTTAGESAQIVMRVYKADTTPTPAPVLYNMHGGGMCMADVSASDGVCIMVARELECVVASIDYRLAPEHPHPTPIEDCYAGLQWLARHGEELGMDLSRLAVGGDSAGAGLAASLALLARDRGEVDIGFQLLIFPMLDDRNVTHSARYVTHPQVWNLEANKLAWHALLGGDAGGVEVSPYAAPARAEDLSGLPPAYIAVGELDLFLDENITYAQRLLQAGVATELHVYPGAFHGSDKIVPESATSQRFTADYLEALRRAFSA